jgi:LysM repeat protein
MADMKNKFMSWTLNVIKETAATTNTASSPPPHGENLYGVGVELALAQPRSFDIPPRKDGELLQRNHQVIIIASLHPSGPAAKMGLQKGDVVIQVDDTQLQYDHRVYTPSDVAQLVRGPEGTFVDVIVERREGGERIQKEFHLRREPIIGIRGRRMLNNSSRAKINTQSASAGGVGAADDGATQKDAASTGVESAETSNKHTAKKSPPDESNSNPKVPSPKMLDRLDSVLNEEKAEEKQKFKALVKEDDEEQSPTFNQDPAPLTSEEVSEEKMQDNDVSSNADNVSDQWELISERSGSAIVISINGSLLSGGGSASHFLRCASPSLLKNKFVLTEYTGESSYLEHVVLPTDTLQGLCLAYKVSATQLRMVNKFSGNSLQMAPKKIKIPMNGVTKGMMIKTQDKTSKEFKLYAFVAEIPTMELIEAKAYLDLSNWDLDEGLRSAREDVDYGWDYYNHGSGAESPAMPMFASSVTAKPKDLTVQDIYDGAAAFEGDGVELKDIPKLLKDDGR